MHPIGDQHGSGGGHCADFRLCHGPAERYVQDDTQFRQGDCNLNMVLCVLGATNPGVLVNAGPYISLVDITSAIPRAPARQLRRGNQLCDRGGQCHARDQRRPP